VLLAVVVNEVAVVPYRWWRKRLRRREAAASARAGVHRDVELRYDDAAEAGARHFRIQQALKAVTLDAAWRCRKEDITGSIEPGKCADFAVLEKDPTAVDPTTIKSIKVVETWLDGYKRHAA
jgi:predicted amidohydrolase YtcJ